MDNLICQTQYWVDHESMLSNCAAGPFTTMETARAYCREHGLEFECIIEEPPASTAPAP